MHQKRMDPTDQTLERFIREWAALHDSLGFEIVIEPETKGGPTSFYIRPANPKSATARLWVGDDGASVSFSVGSSGLWWDREIPLLSVSVQNLLDTVAAGHVEEQIRKVFGRVVALRGTVGVAGINRHKYGQLSPFAILPGLAWETISYQPYNLCT